MDQRIGTTIAGCTIERELGRGGMGVVYLARQESLGRQVAFKLISPQFTDDEQFRARFERESRLAAGLEHPNVVPVYEAGEAEGLLYMVMRYIPGTDLGAVILDQGKVAAARAVDIVEQVASALDEAHDSGLVHRDVKPANILLAPRRTGGDHAYLTDFGLTKRTQSDSALTGTGMMVGTLDYIAPEQLSGGEVSARTDVYALACVLFHALAGQVPFPQPDTVAKMFAHAHEPRPALDSVADEIPRELSEVVQQGMAKEPEERFGSAGELASAARKAVGGSKGTIVGPADTTRQADLAQTRVGEAPPPSEPPTEPPPSDPAGAQPPPVTPPPAPAPATPGPAPVGPGQSSLPPLPAQVRTASTSGPAPRAKTGGRPPLGVILGGLGLLATAIVVLALVLGGGGGDDGGGDSGGGSGGGEASAAAFVREAENVCEDVDELDEAIEVVDDFANPSSPVQLDDVERDLESYVNDAEDAIEELGELEAPEASRADWDRYLELREEQVGEVGDIGEEAGRRRTTRTTFQQDARALQDMVDDAAFDESSEELETLAERAGPAECAP